MEYQPTYSTFAWIKRMRVVNYHNLMIVLRLSLGFCSLTRNYKIFTSFYRTNKPFCTIAVIFGIYIDTSHSVLFHFMPHLELV